MQPPDGSPKDTRFFPAQWLRPSVVVVVLVAGVATSVAGWAASRGGSGGCGPIDSGPGALVAMDTATGALEWTALVGQTAGIAHVEGSVLVRNGGEALRAYNTASGELRWCRSLARSVDDDRDWGVVVVDGVVAVLERSHVVGRDIQTGAELWRTDAPDGEWFVTGGDRIWLRDDGPDALPAIALDPETGAVDATAGRPPTVQALPTTVDGLRLDPDYRPRRGRTHVTVTVRDLDDIALWTEPLPGYFAWIIPTEADPVVVMKDETSAGETLSGYDARTAEPLWDIAANDWSDTPRAYNEELFFLSTGTQIRAIDTATGTQVWAADHGSPGQGGRYEFDGGYFFWAIDDTTFIGLVEAQAPRSD